MTEPKTMAGRRLLDCFAAADGVRAAWLPYVIAIEAEAAEPAVAEERERLIGRVETAVRLLWRDGMDGVALLHTHRETAASGRLKAALCDLSNMAVLLRLAQAPPPTLRRWNPRGTNHAALRGRRDDGPSRPNRPPRRKCGEPGASSQRCVMSYADRLAALREAATPGPWVVQTPDPDVDLRWIDTHAYPGGPEPICGPNYGISQPDARYIVALVNAAPAIEAAIRVVESVALDGCEFGSYDQVCSERWADAPISHWCDPCAARAALAEVVVRSRRDRHGLDVVDRYLRRKYHVQQHDRAMADLRAALKPLVLGPLDWPARHLPGRKP